MQGAKVQKTRIFIICGRRMELMALVQDKAEVLFPKPLFNSYTVQLNHGVHQNTKKMPSYGEFIVSSDFRNKIPVSIDALASKARIWEQDRFRCLHKSCTLRDANEKARLEKSFEEPGGPDASFEMPAEDRESCGLDDAQEEEEAKEQEKEEELLESPTKKRDFICQVFPFALNQ